MATKDLTKAKGMYRIATTDQDPRLEGRVYVGYAINLVADADAWKFATRESAEKVVRECGYTNVIVTIKV